MTHGRRLVHSVLASGLVLFGLGPAVALAQEATIVTGQVSTRGAPVMGASVSIPSLRLGSTSDGQGMYRLTIPASVTGDVTLSVRRIGYVTRSVPITLAGGQLHQDFALEASAVELTTVIVTGLGGEIEKSKLGTSAQQLNAEELNTTRAQNLVEQMQGKVPGVQITGSGTQGGSVNIIIRGQNSITQNRSEERRVG